MSRPASATLHRCIGRWGAIEMLAGTPDMRTRFGRAARRLAEERFASDAIGRAVVELYRRLLAERS